MVEVCGVKYMKGTSRKTGKPYEGHTVYFTEDGAAQQVKGFVADSVFLSSDVLQGRIPDVGDKLDIRYDRRGFVSSVDITK